MNFQDTQDLIDAIKPYCDLSTLSISIDNKDWRGRSYTSDLVRILEKHHVGFEVYDIEIIIFYFDDHIHFEDWISGDITDRSYVARAKEYLVKLFTLPIQKVEVYKGRKLMRFKYRFIQPNNTEAHMAGTTSLHLFANPLSRKTTRVTRVKYSRLTHDFEPFDPSSQDKETVIHVSSPQPSNIDNSLSEKNHE